MLPVWVGISRAKVEALGILYVVKMPIELLLTIRELQSKSNCKYASSK
jgi:hypothetical protein